jgi:formamidopyrimidine-DNA glycosylase
MPELPEVESVRRGLEDLVQGFTVREVNVFDERSIRRNKGTIFDFKEELIGSRLSKFIRRGKFLWVPLKDDRCLVAHLGMSGQILVKSPGEAKHPCERLSLSVCSGNRQLEIRFVDQRLFGGLFLDELISKDSDLSVPKSVGHIALDPLDRNFEIEKVASKILSRSAGIKSLLLNQSIVSGIGNIYADEILWLTRLHYLSPGKSLSRLKVRQILRSAREILGKAVELGGTSFDTQYRNVNGESGKFSSSLNAYGRDGMPCSRCSFRIVRDPWLNRGSHFCPKCQVLKSAR